MSKKFIQLWSHRYRKYTHIAKAYWHFLLIYFRLKWLKMSKLRQKKIIAIVLTQQFGDIVAGEPISRQVRAKHPNDYLIWLVKPIFAELLEMNPNIDETLKEFCANQRRLLLKSGVFDKIYNLQLRNNSHCPVCGVFVDNQDADNQGITIHNYYFHGNLLSVQQKIAGLPIQDFSPKIYISEAHKKRIDALNLPKKFIAIHCQSNQASRDWSAEKWEELVYWILSQLIDYQVVEVGLSSNLNIKNDRYLNLCGKLNLLETAEVIRRAKLYIGIDSGPAHLANAVGTFGVIMIGKLGNFTNHIPYSGDYGTGKNAVIVRNTDGASAEISVEIVIETIKNKIS